MISFVERPFSLRLEGNHAPFEAAARRKSLWLSRNDDNRLKMNRFHEGLGANTRRSWLNSRNGKIRGRALPLAWRVRQCPKGHFPEDLHIALVELVLELIPEGTKVVFLGDGEFDGIKLQETMHEAGWWYACRTSKGNTATWADETFHVDELRACIKPGRLIELKEVALTRDAYGPVLLLCCWARGQAEPLYLVSNMLMRPYELLVVDRFWDARREWHLHSPW